MSTAAARILPRLLLLAGLLAVPARAGVIIVDDDGPADFVTIQEAVDAALAGDVILVQRGEYAGFAIDAKTLVVAAAEPGQLNRPQLLSGIEVRHIGASRTVLLAGLDVPGGGPPVDDALLVEDCDGSVRVNDCLLTGLTEESPDNATCAGVRVLDSADVVLVGCTVVGARGSLLGASVVPLLPASDGGAGLFGDGGAATAWDCTITGGKGVGYYDFWVDSGDGGPGVRAASGRVVLEGCAVKGGSGGDSAIMWATGGAGLIVDAAGQAFVRDTTLAGGFGGLLYNPFSPGYGPSGPATVVDGLLEPLGGAPLLLSANAPVLHPGDSLVLSGGAPGVMLVGLGGANAMLASWSAPLHVNPLLIVPVGAFPLSTVTPALPASFSTLILHLQVAASTHELSAPATFVIAVR